MGGVKQNIATATLNDEAQVCSRSWNKRNWWGWGLRTYKFWGQVISQETKWQSYDTRGTIGTIGGVGEGISEWRCTL